MAKAYLCFYEKFEHKSEYLDSAKKYLDAYKPETQPAEYIYYAYLKNDFQEVINLASNAAAPLAEAVTNYQVGQAYFNLRNLDKSMPYMQKAVNLQPFNLEYRVKLATIYSLYLNLPEAEKELIFVTVQNPKFASAWNGLAFGNPFFINVAAKLFSLPPAFAPGMHRKKYGFFKIKK
jgi:tetratricopeptide (TPR) repeat protein